MNEAAVTTNVEVGGFAEPLYVEKCESRCMELGLTLYEFFMSTVLTLQWFSSDVDWH